MKEMQTEMLKTLNKKYINDIDFALKLLKQGKTSKAEEILEQSKSLAMSLLDE